MPEHQDIITEISLVLIVDGAPERLELPVPFNYDGQVILQLIMEDVVPLNPDEIASLEALSLGSTSCPEALSSLGETTDPEGLPHLDETTSLERSIDFNEATDPEGPPYPDDAASLEAQSGLDKTTNLKGSPDLDETAGLEEPFDPDEVVGAMEWDDFEAWRLRTRDLQEIDYMAGALDDARITPGEWPGVVDLRTGEPSQIELDETIEHDLRNAEVVANGTKAAFRAIRETCGASQAALADALGVSARAVKRWEAPGQPEPPRDAWRLVEGWHTDTLQGARWHVRRAEELRNDYHEAYVLPIYRNQEELDRVLAPLLAKAPSYHWQDALAESRERALAERGSDSWLEVDHPYTNFPGTRSFWRANAAARLAAILMDAEGIPYGFAYPGEHTDSLLLENAWVPRADVQRIESPDSTIVTCGMR